jgi:hypothetical protein
MREFPELNPLVLKEWVGPIPKSDALQLRMKFALAEPESGGHHACVVKASGIRRFVNAVAREFNPERVVLFGSYARGEATEDSDVDLLVIQTRL